MTKYDFDFKVKVVKEYLNGGGSLRSVSKKYGIPGSTHLHDWVMRYQHFGEEGLLPQKGKKEYSVQFKLNAVELYLTKTMTSQKLAYELGLISPALLRSWAFSFRDKGLAGLSGSKEIQPDMTRDNKKQILSPDDNLDDATRIKDLETQVLALKIQNAYLKELRSLQTKRKQNPTNKLPESSTDSANNSNSKTS